VGRPDNPWFEELPGGNIDDLDGTKFGGVTIDDLIISSYEGYQLNGHYNSFPAGSVTIYPC
jgi:hypothetical protein